MARRPVDNSNLQRWRQMDAALTLGVLCTYCKQDRDFVPTQAKGTTRWNVTSDWGEFEFLCLGPKFFDTRARKGGGGAIDLTMHLMGISFVDAVRHLNRLSL